MNKRTIVLGILIATPMLALAQEDTGLVKCGQDSATGCGYDDLIALVQNTLNYVIYYLATPIAALMFGVAGFQMITSGGDTNQYKKARKIFTNVMIGYGIMLAAFLIIKLLFSFLFPEDYSLLG